MKLFTCTHCGQLVYFENNHCEQCGYQLGFVPADLQLYALELQSTAGSFSLVGKDAGSFRYCANHEADACNWLVPASENTLYCKACRLNRTIPYLGNEDYLQRWRRIEVAKHRLVYSLLRLQLPVNSKNTHLQQGLAFDFLADENTNDGEKRILTGHAAGLITLNIAEADDIEREMTRRAMGEGYRTLLGHFRHEIGHYYWDLLLLNSSHLDRFRTLFGDERRDYAEALQQYYQQGPAPNWLQQYISAYASSHPWEDWAETWAHYLHIIDTLETAYSFGLTVKPLVSPVSSLQAAMEVDPYNIDSFEMIIQLWLPLTFAMNSLNRSMGLPDAYPFVLWPPVLEKLKFIHTVCHGFNEQPSTIRSAVETVAGND